MILRKTLRQYISEINDNMIFCAQHFCTGSSLIFDSNRDATLLFHDYETWGIDPRYDFACQFAAIRTDSNLNIIDKPVSYFCQIPNDYLPHPGACLITGITPQQSLRDGMIEAEFARKIETLMSTANTCVVGYNSIRFDDEVTRNLFYRNFIDPYEREYKHGNSRWDIIDLVRACYALRPQGIQWPVKEDGSPSFKLEELTAYNDIAHAAAHDAVSDVKATIEFTKLIKEAQPKLFDYFFDLRKKANVNRLIQFDFKSPLVYVSGIISAKQGCTTLILPICAHPSNTNTVICIDLNTDCSIFSRLNESELRDLLYKNRTQLAEHEQRPGIKTLSVNKSPFLAPAKTLTDEIAQRLGINLQDCRNNLKVLMQCQDLSNKLSATFSHETEISETDVDAGLYVRGFPSAADKEWMKRVVNADPEQLTAFAETAPTLALKSQLLRYRARNYPQTLSESELETWQRHRQSRFNDGNKKTCLSAQEFHAALSDLAQANTQNAKKMKVLASLEHFLNDI